MSEPRVLYEWTDERGDRNRIVGSRFWSFTPLRHQYLGRGEWHHALSVDASSVLAREILRLLSELDDARKERGEALGEDFHSSRDLSTGELGGDD